MIHREPLTGTIWKSQLIDNFITHLVDLDFAIFTDGYTSSKAKRARAGQVKHKSTITMYNKMAEMISNLSELLEIQELTDTTILQVILRNRNLFL
jgi:hypothetical protein